MKNLNLVINTFFKLCVIIALIVAASTKQQYSYYNFIRWVTMIAFIYFAYQSYFKKQIGLLIYFIAVAIIFNPFKIVWFQKETWHLIDYLVAAITAGTVVYDWVINKTKNYGRV